MLILNIDKEGGTIRLQAIECADNKHNFDVMAYPIVDYYKFDFTEREAIKAYRIFCGLVGRRTVKRYTTVCC